MKRLTLVVFFTAMVIAGATGAVSQALAQALTDAQQAFQEARTAYDSLRFSEARDLAQKASETDAKNPDIFLLLGKAHYQLGELDEAMAAWNQTLVLAPKESFAKKMLEVLQSRRKDVDARIRYIESLLPTGWTRSLLLNAAIYWMTANRLATPKERPFSRFRRIWPSAAISQPKH